MGRRPEQTFSQRNADGQQAHEKMLNIINHQGEANQNHKGEISPHTCQNGYHQKDANSKCWWGCGEKGTLVQCWWECKLVQPLWKILWRFLKKLKIELPAMTQQFHSWVYIQKNPKTLFWKDTCTTMFITGLFTIAKIWKQPKCPSTDEWIKKMLYTHTHTHNGILLRHKKEWTFVFAATWRDLEDIMLSEISQRKTSSTVLYHLHVLPKKYIKVLHITEKKQNHRYREQISGFQWGVEE